MNKLKIGIVGCGAIGSSLAKIIREKFFRDSELAALYDVELVKAQKLSVALCGKKELAADSLKELIGRSGFVIECARAQDSWDIASNALRAGRDVMVMSVGGIAAHYKDLIKLARKGNCRVYIPSGAISGLDALKAANQQKISKVMLVTRKNPRSFAGVEYIKKRRINLAGIKKDKVIFSGSAQEAVKHFPQNINVASVLSLAGIGQEKTRVKIIASPGTSKNIHEVSVISDAGNIFTRTENILHPDNPKTSYMAVLSAEATLKQVLHPIKIGT
ncbi:MAG: aspartate dehydrogenase [Candidatus Omnitrophica bacterium]|nr:aspartate dehydrogenase [Candidatus Omnitrophota bacterium]